MGSSYISHSRFQDLDQRPLMLKDFLRDDHESNSCSSSASPFGSDQCYPRNIPSKSTVLRPPKSNDLSKVLLSRRSKSVAVYTISAFHKVVNLVKMLPFSSLGKAKNDGTLQDFKEVKLKVKDILRGTSFKALDVEKSPPLDHLTSIEMESTSCSSTSSWSESDFTAKDCENKHCFNDIPKGEWPSEEYDQQSPTSVLDDSLFLDNEDSLSPCHTYNIAEGKKHVLLRRIQEHEVCKNVILEDGRVRDAVEEKAKRLLSRVKESNGESHDDHLMLDFFGHELSIFGKLDDSEFHGKILEVARSWKSGEYKELLQWEEEENREAFVKDMEREVGWSNKFNCEVEEMCKELQMELWSEVLDDFLVK